MGSNAYTDSSTPESLTTQSRFPKLLMSFVTSNFLQLACFPASHFHQQTPHSCTVRTSGPDDRGSRVEYGPLIIAVAVKVAKQSLRSTMLPTIA